MSKPINSTSHMTFDIILRLSETEARALKAITEYGEKEFLNTFKTELGKAGIEDYEDGIVSLFSTIQKELPLHLAKIDKTKKLWS